ncbi:hypothetical protein RvY_02474 [Ramazzottius varieornatus]|uniref:peptidylprolyl isomerase n=1 Tax=Ramazzottius varieornatus TaxID=947166 RepID=A0A1D1UN63_RAMVA|nr:hypothetical protein RvY_02474 [Ramazzottius varieornatus]
MSSLWLVLCAALLLLASVFAQDEELGVEVLAKQENCDREAKEGDMLMMHYTGYLAKDNTKFDSSHDRQQPFTFVLGKGQVIKGWDQGLMGMCKGEKRKLTVPPHLGYGDRGAGAVIPGGATLIFDTELVDIQDAPPQQNIFKQIDTDEDKIVSKVELYKFIEGQIAQAREAGQTAPDINTDKIVAEILEHEDADKDGFISFEEFRGPKHDEL